MKSMFIALSLTTAAYVGLSATPVQAASIRDGEPSHPPHLALRDGEPSHPPHLALRDGEPSHPPHLA